MQHSMEGVSRAYIAAIASQSGLGCTKPDPDYVIYGIFSDIKIRDDGRRIDNGFKIDF